MKYRRNGGIGKRSPLGKHHRKNTYKEISLDAKLAVQV
jgi:hypothetical protein